MSDRTDIQIVRDRINGYITALMVDDGKHVASCEQAMDDALNALAARITELEETLRKIAGPWDESVMRQARTLHYDMAWWASQALRKDTPDER